MQTIRFNVQTILGGNYISAGSHFQALSTQILQVQEGCACDGSLRTVDKTHYQVNVNDQLFLVNEDLVTVIPSSDSPMLEPGSPQDRINDRLLTNVAVSNFDPVGAQERANRMTVIDLRKR